MSSITCQPVLTLDGNVATLTFSKIDGDGCDLSVAYVCDQFRGRFCNKFVLPSDFDSAGLCWRQYIYSFPQLELPVINDGFAVADDPFDISEEYWEFADDSEIITFVALEIDLSETPLSKESSPIAALLRLHMVSGEQSAGLKTSLEDSLPDTAPGEPVATGPIPTSVDGKFTLDLTEILQAKINILSEDSTLDALYVMIQINPTGSSGDPVQIASSRHSDESLRPKLSLRW